MSMYYVAVVRVLSGVAPRGGGGGWWRKAAVTPAPCALGECRTLQAQGRLSRARNAPPSTRLPRANTIASDMKVAERSDVICNKEPLFTTY